MGDEVAEALARLRQPTQRIQRAGGLEALLGIGQGFPAGFVRERPQRFLVVSSLLERAHDHQPASLGRVGPHGRHHLRRREVLRADARERGQRSLVPADQRQALEREAPRLAAISEGEIRLEGEIDRRQQSRIGFQ